ncbi:MAG: winged helix-turn-helix transcriptional regulator [archaeon]|nr:winged helix-turn-helix transcriptional regulator [archaeon]
MKNQKNRKKIVETLSKCNDFGDPEEFYDELVDIGELFRREKDENYIFNCFKALGNLERFLILESLKQKDRCVCELEGILNKSQPAVSHHLDILEKLNLIQGWKKGKFTHYSLIKQNFEKISKNFSDWTEEITNIFGGIKNIQ